MNDNNKFPKQAKPQEFELIELLFREYISSHIARPDIEYSFQARFQSFINQIPSYLHSSSKTGFFTHFFFGSFSSLLDTKLGQKLGVQKLHFNFDQANHLRIVAEANDKTHVFIFTENNQKEKHNKQKKIDFTKDEWKTITGQEYTDNDNKKLEINVININKSKGSINVAVEKKSIQDGDGSTRQYNAITKQCVDNDGQYIALENEILTLSVGEDDKSQNAIEFILKYIKKIHDHYQGLPYGNGSKEADEHGFVSGIFNNFRYRENTHVYLEQFAGKGYADIVLLVRGADRATKSIPIIIELKAGTGTGTNAGNAVTQVEEYTKGFQPNNMRILSLSDHVLCVGMNLDMPTDSFIQTQVVARDQVVAPLIQQIINQLVTEDIFNQNPAPDDLIVIQQTIKQYLEQTYNTFPGTGEKSSAHYMSRFILGESLVLRDYDKHIFIYDKEYYIPTVTVIDDHDTRSNKKPRIERTVDGSNAVNSLLLISKAQDNPAIVLNIIDINREVNDVIKLPLDTVKVGNRKIISLDIEFRLDKSLEGFQQYCDVEIGKIYNSVLEYNNENTIKAEGTFHKISFKDSVKLVAQMKNAIDSQKGLVILQEKYTELLGNIGEVVYPIKSLIGRESEFQGLLEGIFKYYSDVKLSEGSERRELVLTEFQTGAGGRIDMLVQAIGSSEQGTKEYIPVGFELKYVKSIMLTPYDKKQKQSEDTQRDLLDDKAKHVVDKLLTDQTERYSKGAAIKSITDGNKVGIIGVVFNGQAQEPSKLLITTDKLLEANIVHSSKAYTIGSNIAINIREVPKSDDECFIPSWVSKVLYDKFEEIQEDDGYSGILFLSCSEIDNNKVKELQHLLQTKAYSSLCIDGIDLSYNEITAISLESTSKLNQLVYLDVSDNDLANDNLAALDEVIENIQVPVLRIADVGMNSDHIQRVFRILSTYDTVAALNIMNVDDNSLKMSCETADVIAQYLTKTIRLNALDISKNKIDDQAIEHIALGLRHNTVLNTLVLQDNMITLEGCNKLSEYLVGTRVSYLDLSGNPLGVYGVEAISDMLETSHTVEVLTLVNVGFDHMEDDKNVNDMIEIIDSLFTKSNLVNLDLSYNDMGVNVLDKIFDILSSESHDESEMRVLSLAGNIVPQNEAQKLTNSISKFLTKNRTLRSLDLSKIQIGDDLGAIIAKSLSDNISLVALNLGYNLLSTKTVAELVKTLSTNIYIRYLDLVHNKLTVQDFNVILKALKDNKVLVHLDLSKNDFSPSILYEEDQEYLNLDSMNIDFQCLLRGNTSLKYLGLAFCNLEQQSLLNLFKALEHNQSIEVLDIRGNNLNKEIIEKILISLEKNINQGIGIGLKILHLDKQGLANDVISSLIDKAVGISVLVDGYVAPVIPLEQRLIQYEQHLTEISTRSSEAMHRSQTDSENHDVDQQPAACMQSKDELVRTCTISQDLSEDAIYQDESQTFESETMLSNHRYWLQQHDIVEIARVHYNYSVLHSYNNSYARNLEVGTNLSQMLVDGISYTNRHNAPFTIIYNINSNHWVSLVLSGNQIYYINSSGIKMPSDVQHILWGFSLGIHDLSVAQQTDSHNCGLWALENARMIIEALSIHPNINEERELDLILQNRLADMSNNLGGNALNSLRDNIAQELVNDPMHQVVLQEILGADPVQQSLPISDQSQQSSLYGCIALSTISSYSSKRMQDKRSIILSNKNNKLLDSKKFIDCAYDVTIDSISYNQLIKLVYPLKIVGNNKTCNVFHEYLLHKRLEDSPSAKYTIPLSMWNKSNYWSLLHKAAWIDNIAEAERLINKEHQDINVRSFLLEITPLHVASGYGNVEMVQFLIKNSANVNAKTSSKYAKMLAPLHFATNIHNEEIVNELIHKGADVNAQDIAGWSALCLAAIKDDTNLFSLLLRAKADAKLQFNYMHSNTSILHIASLNNNLKILHSLNLNQTSINDKDANDWTALHYAICGNSFEAAKFLLHNKININPIDREGNTLLHFIVQSNNNTCVSQYSVHGSRPRSHDIEKVWVDFLVNNGADIYHFNNQQMRPKSIVADYNKTYLMDSLFRDIIRDSTTYTPLTTTKFTRFKDELRKKREHKIIPSKSNNKTDDLMESVINEVSEANDYHKHRHHHGEHVVHYRGRRDIDHVWEIDAQDDNDNHLLDAKDDIFVVRNAGSSLKPLGDNIVHWIRDSILLFKTLNPIRQVKNLFNEYNDTTKTITSDLDISDNVVCKEGQKQDSLVNKFSIVQEINDQMYELGEAQLAATKLLQELCQQLNSVEKEILRQEELEDTIINIYQKEEDFTIKQGDLQDKKQELYHIKEQIESQKSVIESLRSTLNSLNHELAMLHVKDNHEVPYWNKSLEEDVEVDDDIADQVPIWIKSNHHINVGNVPNSFIGNDRDKKQVLDDSLCDFQGTLSLWNLLIRKKYGVHYNHQHDIMQSEEVDTEYAHRLAYKVYASIYDTSQENIELSGISMVD